MRLRPSLRRIIIILSIVLLSVTTAGLCRPANPFTTEAGMATLEVRAAYDRRDYDEAYRLGKEGMEEHPENLGIVSYFLLTTVEMNRLSEIPELFRPDHYPEELRYVPHFARAWFSLRSGQMLAARDELEQAEALATGDIFELRMTRLMLERSGNEWSDRKLSDELDRLIADYPDVAPARVLYIEIMRMQDWKGKRHRKAIKDALEAPARNGQVYTHAVDLEMEDFWFDPAAGLAIIEKGLGEFPDDLGLIKYRVLMLRKLGRLEEALADCRRAHAIAPNHGDFYDEEFEILEHLGRWDEAIEATRAKYNLKYQEYLQDDIPLNISRIHHLSGNPGKAAEVLYRALEEDPGWYYRGAARGRLTALEVSQPGEGVRLLPFHAVLEQRGNYCGPATLNMVLRYWDIDRSQEDIAKRVYTGIAGTPPQVIRDYVESLGLESLEFSGNDEDWKALIDAGYPVLWLQMLGWNGGHYRVIVGYDDIEDNWLIHDPNNYSMSSYGYEWTEDEWPPDLRRSIVLFPPERANDPVLGGLDRSFALVATNWLLYISTGSNLFVSPLPALLTNAVIVALITLVAGYFLRRVTYPNARLGIVRILATTLAVALSLNIIIAIFHTGTAVSLLLGFHIALLLMVPLLLLVWGVRVVTQDFLHPMESIGLCVLVAASWMSLTFIDRQPWETLTPLLLFGVGLPLIMRPRLRVLRAERLSQAGDFTAAIDLTSCDGWRGRQYYAALIVEMDSLFSLGQFNKVLEIVDHVLSRRKAWPRNAANVFELHRLYALALLGREAEALEGLRTLLATRKPARTHLLLARALCVLLDPSQQDGNFGVEIDDILRDLARVGLKHLPGFPTRRSNYVHPIYTAASLLALKGAIREAQSQGDLQRATALRQQRLERYGLLFHLLPTGDSSCLNTLPRFEAEKKQSGAEKTI